MGRSEGLDPLAGGTDPAESVDSLRFVLIFAEKK